MTLKVQAIYTPDLSTPCERPVFVARVPAGFPSPADDYIEGKLDLNQYLIKHPAATFPVRVTGDSMEGAGIRSGDLLIVDRKLEPKDGSVVIAVLDGELTVKRLSIRNGKPVLLPDNEKYPPVEVGEECAFEIWGVVTYVIHEL
ncbi:MAG TPA: translesion error-prone DNA polymerase V autoproteolytic subunit [Nitrospiraceae bacterium]|nr:translesion error-prone DNA polymerase V autoproteolytic subunit [Nitrospiraceae bacterium]